MSAVDFFRGGNGNDGGGWGDAESGGGREGGGTQGSIGGGSGSGLGGGLGGPTTDADGFMQLPSTTGLTGRVGSVAGGGSRPFNPATSSAGGGSIAGGEGGGSGSARGGMGGAKPSGLHKRGRPYTPVSSYAEDYLNDAPLLEELGVDFGHIANKVLSVLVPTKAIDDTIMVDSDMAGPIAFCLVLGFFLLLAGKVHFGYIYGLGGFGCIAMNLILNLMSHTGHSLDVSRTFSVLGYGLLPIVGLAGVAVLFDLRGLVGAVLGACIIAWCTWSATRFFEAAMHMQQQRWLIAYPTCLFYACFVLITVF